MINTQAWSKGWDAGYLRGLARAIELAQKEHDRLYKKMAKGNKAK